MAPLDLVGLGGFEPPTSPLSGVRSDQLSYRPASRSATFPNANGTERHVRISGNDIRAPRILSAHQVRSVGPKLRRWLARSRNLLWALNAGHAPLASQKEVIQPQVPLRLPCYDFTPVTDHTVVGALTKLSNLLLVQPAPMV